MHQVNLPKAQSEMLVAAILNFFLFGSCFAALNNLIIGQQLLPSVFWLLGVAIVILVWGRERGPLNIILSLFGGLTPHHFAETIQAEQGPKYLRIGFRISQRRFYTLAIPLNKIRELNWEPGTRSQDQGVDASDWQVALGFEFDDSTRYWRPLFRDSPFSRRTVKMGSSGSRDQAFQLGQELRHFLSSEGVQFRRINDQSFVTEDKPRFYVLE